MSKSPNTYEIVEVLRNGELTWTVIEYDPWGTCRGGDVNWLEHRYAVEAKRAYEQGLVEHGSINSVEQIPDGKYKSKARGGVIAGAALALALTLSSCGFPSEPTPDPVGACPVAGAGDCRSCPPPDQAVTWDACTADDPVPTTTTEPQVHVEICPPYCGTD